MEIPDWTSPIDCPACGASSETNLAFASVRPRGVDVACDACGLRIIEGSINARGAERTPEDVYDQAWWLWESTKSAERSPRIVQRRSRSGEHSSALPG